MNKFSNVLSVYDALLEEIGTSVSMSARLAADDAAKNFRWHLINILTSMVRTQQDYTQALEILELYPEFSDVADYLVDPANYDWKAVWQGEEDYMSDPAFYEDADYAMDLLDLMDFDWTPEEFAEPNRYELLVDAVRRSQNEGSANNRLEEERESDSEFYDKQKGITWQDQEDLLWLESVYH